MPEETSPNFLLIHGAWFGPDSWRPFADILNSRDYQTIIPDLPAEDVNLTFDDDTRVVEQAIEGTDNLFIVSHSRGFQVLPGLLRRIGTSRVIGMAILSSGGLHELSRLFGSIGPRYNRGFDKKIKNINGLTTIDEASAREYLLNDVSDEGLIKFALSGLRQQRSVERSLSDQPLPPMPSPQELPRYVLLGSQDKLLNARKARKLHRHYLQAEAVSYPWGHFPQLSQPLRLANIIEVMALQCLNDQT